MRYSKNRVTTITFWAFIFCACFIFPITYYIGSKYGSKLIYNLARKRMKTKAVLYWIPKGDNPASFSGDEGFEVFKSCEVSNCFATYDRGLIPLGEFDAILFHTSQYSKKYYKKPYVRTSKQRYVFVSSEPPTVIPLNVIPRYNWVYNWTMTYRTDSDIKMPTGYLKETKTNYVMPNEEFIKNKTNFGVWMPNKCVTSSKREVLIHNLKMFVNVDIYGTCGNLTCNPNDTLADCYKLIERKYKFYFVLEHSHCKDYVSEEIYKILKLNIVPIVYGGARYGDLLPPYSFISADMSQDANEMVDYLIYLDENPYRYLEYFAWKKDYVAEMQDKRKPMCELCKMLHEPFQPSKTYESICPWWNGKKTQHCKRGQALPDIVQDTTVKDVQSLLVN